MAYTLGEVEDLKEYIKEIVDECYLRSMHEMRKKLSVANNKIIQVEEKLKNHKKIVEEYRKCHGCHRVNVDLQDATTQTEPNATTDQESFKTGHTSRKPEPEQKTVSQGTSSIEPPSISAPTPAAVSMAVDKPSNPIVLKANPQSIHHNPIPSAEPNTSIKSIFLPPTQSQNTSLVPTNDEPELIEIDSD